MTVDYVLVDTPPITASIDAAVISKNVDAIIVATEQGKTTSRELRKLVNALQKVNTRILGFVLTKYRAKKKIGYYQTDYHQL